ncbi:hypothetical protein GGI07_004337 [Coemansia sp. Benny D115]|nr:hypothetical protein GGI07_004337 [Coemansia sp. Benny D115]
MEGVYIYPPLGTLTCVREATVYFRVHFVYSDSSSSPSEAELWTNMYSSQGWQSIALHRSACTDGPATTRLPTELAFLDPNQLPSKQSRIQQFALDVAVTSDVSSYFEYTVRWKTSASAEWHWAGSVGQNARISVLLRNNTSYSVQTPLNHWRLKLKSVFEPIQAENRSDRRLTAVADSWNVSPTSASCAFKLGEPLSPSVEEGVGQVGRLADVHRYLAFVRKDQFWIIPHVGTQSIDTRGMDIVVLLAELRSGAYVAMMPTACTSTPAAYSAVLYIDAAQSISIRMVR